MILPGNGPGQVITAGQTNQRFILIKQPSTSLPIQASGPGGPLIVYRQPHGQQQQVSFRYGYNNQVSIESYKRM